MSLSEKNRSEVSEREEEILAWWEAENIFSKSIENRSSADEYVFYDGPPFATGLPHYGHILASTIKDAIPRYQTMKGKKVLRRWGWDCHGLPLENIIEKELGLKTKKDIEEFGIDKFNQAARQAVLRYADDWKQIIPRLGRWVDMENDYRTMSWRYSESIWWVFKTLYEQGMIYEAHKSMHLCPRCQTTLANFEVNLGYREISDLSVTVVFPLADDPETGLLAWTTTPWTLPGNAALAVGSDISYAVVEKFDQVAGRKKKYILAEEKVSEVFPDNDHKVVKKISGRDLEGKKYQPVFEYYSRQADLKGKDQGWQIYSADFVTTEEGTGVVHIAPAFGEDDMALGRQYGLPFIQHVTFDGCFSEVVTEFAGLPVKPPEDHQSADVLIIKYLAGQNRLFDKKKISHPYPHCWRCDTPLLNYAADSWFLAVSEIKDRLLAANDDIYWVPEHIKEGRFGKWLAGVRDWAISRSRFWGAPVPVWRCDSCKELKVVGSVEELSQSSPGSNNTYRVMRHGQAESNELGVLSCGFDDRYQLTEKGKEGVRQTASELKENKPDIIITSPLARTKETAFLVAEELGLPESEVVVDDRLAEVQVGEFSGRPVREYHDHFKDRLEKFTVRPPGGENLNDLKVRVMEAIFDLEAKYRDKDILLITHEYPAWMLFAGAWGLDDQEADSRKDQSEDFLQVAQVRPLKLLSLPRNEFYQLDLHRPFIDKMSWQCSCGGQMKRIPEVFDCWLESGAMPYGQAHYPFDNREIFDPETGVGFPADFIAEGLDQTRGWFYSLLVLGVALFDRSPYRRTIVNGLVLAEDGQKMSKKLNNYPDPMEIVGKYGADALRLYLLSSPAVRGEDVAFKESEVALVGRRVIGRLRNVLSFYDLYAEKDVKEAEILDISQKSVLDRWFMARLNQASGEISDGFDNYLLDRVGRAIDDLVDDLSVWYLRRSRERFKSDEDRVAASAVLRFGLKTTAKLIAPFAPFVAEDIYLAVKADSDPESVHLTDWPVLAGEDKGVLDLMAEARALVSWGLEARSEAGVKVRQPLACLKVKEASEELKSDHSIQEVIKDELNVKKLIFDPGISSSVVLDLELTDELRREGDLRELVRSLQSLRKTSNLKPGQTAKLRIFSLNDVGREWRDLLDQAAAETDLLVEWQPEKIEGRTVQWLDQEFLVVLE